MNLWESTPGMFKARSLSSGEKRLELLVTPAEKADEFLVLPAGPAPVRDAAGHPAVSLTLVLERQPDAGEDIRPLVRQCLLGLTLCLEVPAWALEAMRESGEAASQLFARSAKFEIATSDGGAILTSALGAGTAPRAAVSVLLGSEAACKALDALRGNTSGLAARATVEWRPPMHPPPLPGVRDVDGLESVSVSVPLEEILAVDPGEIDRYLGLVAPRVKGSGLEDVPPSRSGPVVRAVKEGASFAAMGSRIASISSVLHPAGISQISPAQAQAAVRLGKIDSAVLDDAVLSTETLSLPIVQNASVPLWTDRVDPRRRWYAPSFELVRPSGSDTTSGGPFIFRWKQVGVTAGPEAKPGLEGTAVFTLRAAMPASVRDALAAAGNPQAKPVPVSGLKVNLEVPFRKEGTGATMTQLFPAKVVMSGDLVTATVGLLDNWVRLCYGALAYENFQPTPPRLLVSWSFRAYVPVQSTPHLAFGGKIAITPMAEPDKVPGKLAFDPVNVSLHLPGMVTKFQPEQGIIHRSIPLKVAQAVRKPAASANTPVVVKPAAVQLLAVQHPVMAVRPELQTAASLADKLGKINYALRTVARGQSINALLLCKDNMTTYRQVGEDGIESVAGCQDALKLGEISYKQFEEIPALRQDDSSGRLCSVYRSLQQPGRYMVAPARWRIARYGPSDGADRAFRPTAMVYALREGAGEDTRYFISAQLEPDIPLHVRRELERRLASMTPTGYAPVLDYPTEPSLQAVTSFRWGVTDKIALPQVTTQWDGFQVTISAGLTDALLLTNTIERTGIAGEVKFTFPDGQELTGELMLDTAFTGPWTCGPVEVQVHGYRATLVNRVNVPVDVTDLVADSRLGIPVLPVEATLAPGETVEVQLSGTAFNPYPVAIPRPGSPKLEETDLFVEDVTTNVIFVNLVNYANHGIAKLAVKARLQGTDHVYEAEVDEGQHAELDMVLPLTGYLKNQTLDICLGITYMQGDPVSTEWQGWDLEKWGSVISITPEMLPPDKRTAAAGPAVLKTVTLSGLSGARGKGGKMDQDTKTRGVPKGISIHIGLNHIDPAQYGTNGELDGCVNDANAMRDIAANMGYSTNMLLDENATSNAVLEIIGKAAQQLVTGDQLLLTYSGHGGQIPDDTGEEADGQDETWALYDRQLLDDELYVMWSKFAAGVRIFVLSDSCHSGTMLKVLKHQNEQSALMSVRNLKGIAPKIRLLDHDKALKNYNDNKDRYRSIQWVTGRPKDTAGNVDASVLLISGCQDNQFSQDGASNGLFTEKLLDVWNSGNFTGTYPDFYKAITALMPAEQTPNYYKVGVDDPVFEGMKPFVIATGSVQGGTQPSPSAATDPSIYGPGQVSRDGDPPTFTIDPSPYSYYAVELASEYEFFYGGSGQRTEDNSYGSWQDVHLSERGSGSTFTLPKAAWEKLKNNPKLYYRVWATESKAAAEWNPYKIAYGEGPVSITS